MALSASLRQASCALSSEQSAGQCTSCVEGQEISFKTLPWGNIPSVLVAWLPSAAITQMLGTEDLGNEELPFCAALLQSAWVKLLPTLHQSACSKYYTSLATSLLVISDFLRFSVVHYSAGGCLPSGVHGEAGSKAHQRAHFSNHIDPPGL